MRGLTDGLTVYYDNLGYPAQYSDAYLKACRAIYLELLKPIFDIPIKNIDKVQSEYVRNSFKEWSNCYTRLIRHYLMKIGFAHLDKVRVQYVNYQPEIHNSYMFEIDPITCCFKNDYLLDTRILNICYNYMHNKADDLDVTHWIGNIDYVIQNKYQKKLSRKSRRSK